MLSFKNRFVLVQGFIIQIAVCSRDANAFGGAHRLLFEVPEEGKAHYP